MADTTSYLQHANHTQAYSEGMILLNNFYSPTKVDHLPGSIKASVQLNKNHAIFDGHFPGVPIVPGVCMMQLVKELMQVHVDLKLYLTAADNMKFLAVLDPSRHEAVEVDITYHSNNKEYQIKAVIFAGEVTFFKLNATLQIAG